MKYLSKSVTIISLWFIIYFFASCQTDKHIFAVYNDRADILSTFSDMSLYRRGPIILLYVYDSGLTNMYVFREHENAPLESLNESIQFNFKGFNRINMNDTTPAQLVNSLFMKMKPFTIREFVSEYQKFGVPLKICFDDYYEMFYVPDMDAVANPEWKKDVNSANKLDDYWYWRRLK